MCAESALGSVRSSPVGTGARRPAVRSGRPRRREPAGLHESDRRDRLALGDARLRSGPRERQARRYRRAGWFSRAQVLTTPGVAAERTIRRFWSVDPDPSHGQTVRTLACDGAGGIKDRVAAEVAKLDK